MDILRTCLLVSYKRHTHTHTHVMFERKWKTSNTHMYNVLIDITHFTVDKSIVKNYGNLSVRVITEVNTMLNNLYTYIDIFSNS